MTQFTFNTEDFTSAQPKRLERHDIPYRMPSDPPWWCHQELHVHRLELRRACERRSKAATNCFCVTLKGANE